MAKKKTAGKRYSTRRASASRRERGSRIRRILFSILVVLIVAAAIFFLVFRNDGQVTIFENAAGSLFSPVQNAFRTVTEKFRGFFTERRNYAQLQEDYASLSFENEQLRMELQAAEENAQENERLKELLDAKSTYDSLEPIYAKVIARDAGPWFKTFSINRGSTSGVTTNMAVVNGDGLIGRVYEVGLNYAKVLSIIDTRSRVACLLQRTRDNGVMYGEIANSDSAASCFVYYLPNVNSITPGDVVVTSGMDSLYPKGLKIGTVTGMSLDAGSEGTYAIVTPSVDFQRIEEVFVLRTVIETDSDHLDPVTTPEATYQAFATLAPDATATPETINNNPIWSQPTVMPSDDANAYSSYKVGNLPEDTWAQSDKD